MSRRRFYDSSHSSPHAYGGSLVAREKGSPRLDGCVSTPFGYVRVIGLKHGIRSWEMKRGRWEVLGGEGPITRLWMIWSGRHYERTYPRILTYIGAVRAAGRFAREVAST
jgi:hypothetical protein